MSCDIQDKYRKRILSKLYFLFNAVTLSSRIFPMGIFSDIVFSEIDISWTYRLFFLQVTEIKYLNINRIFYETKIFTRRSPTGRRSKNAGRRTEEKASGPKSGRKASQETTGTDPEKRMGAWRIWPSPAEGRLAVQQWHGARGTF
jgi:hypothetical protein